MRISKKDVSFSREIHGSLKNIRINFELKINNLLYVHYA